MRRRLIVVFPILLSTFLFVSSPSSTVLASHDALRVGVLSLGASRFHYNRRHNSNAISVSRLLSHTIPPLFPHPILVESVLGVADDVQCDLRSRCIGRVPYEACIRAEGNSSRWVARLVVEPIPEIRLRGPVGVSKENLRRLLVGEHPYWFRSPLEVFVFFLSAHGGENFVQFQDTEDVDALELTSWLKTLMDRRLARRLLLIVDTCAGESLFQHGLIEIPEVLAISSSAATESAYSSGFDARFDAAVSDEFSRALVHVLCSTTMNPSRSLGSLIEDIQLRVPSSTVSVVSTLQSDWKKVSRSPLLFVSPENRLFSPKRF